MVNKSTLSGIYLFKDLTPRELDQVAAICTSQEVTSGQEIFFTGQDAQGFFVIQQGGVKIFSTTGQGDEVEISRLGSGSHFGEMAFITGDKRSATAQAIEMCYLTEVPFSKLRELMAQNIEISNKIYRSMTQFLATRLKATTQNFAEAKETKLRHF